MQLIGISGIWRLLVAFLVLVSALGWSAEAQEDYDLLIALNQRVLDAERPALSNGLPDHSPKAIAARYSELENIRTELLAFDTTDWPVAQRSDYLLVLTKLNKLVFQHKATRPWARDPLFYIGQIATIPYADVPTTDEARGDLRAQLERLPKRLQNAQDALTEPVNILSRLAVFRLDNFDGVGFREPIRETPPEGIIGWYQDLCERLEAAGEVTLLPACSDAAASVIGFRDWLSAEIPTMTETGSVGTEHYDWYLKHVRLLPYSRDYLKAYGEREFHRYRYMNLVEQNKNKELPELSLTQSGEEHIARTQAAEDKTRQLIEDQSLFTIPDYASDYFETDVYWSERAKTDRHFWEEIQFRNALNNHIHASFPGHRFDGLVTRNIENPIRRTHRESGRSEGWATYLEELFILAGIADDEPRAKEIFYAALIKRGSRFAEIDMHAGDIAFEGVIDYMIDWVPYMEMDIGRFDVAGYVRRPSVGTMYLVGKMQIETLASERAHQLGEAFDLGAFHDELLSKGQIPVSLIRWEMTGYDDEIAALWPEVTGTPFVASD